MTALVELRNVVKRYKRGRQQVEVLHNLDLSKRVLRLDKGALAEAPVEAAA